ncbi:MAG: DNA-binding response regulator [Acidobacteria bacterium]|nr:MAG: DNA-binding response regulator [Acidobacteriota bacterium]PYU48197.1 MAG: DNA-binding response regulator [Acidobacteriota bacterium]PYU60561.1 MAG: DNA-binding response regulator [Acidobacteriota bacterium]PYU70890.1 MAG: DNA-binding response regulator [Acidobacteriota bacterium]
MNENILLIEDEQALRMTLSDRLQGEGYVVDFSPDGEQGFEKATTLPFDLIILDIMLPRRSGLDVCRDIRLAGLGTPILLLTARGQTVDKVVGFKLGADDYVTKPFDTLELMARIEALLRRAPTRTGQGILQFGSVRVDIRGTQVTREGTPVYLSAREFQLLRYFIERKGITLSRDEILREVWGYEAGTFTRTVDVHVASLRQKLEKTPKKPEIILTVPGIGYKFQG